MRGELGEMGRMGLMGRMGGRKIFRPNEGRRTPPTLAREVTSPKQGRSTLGLGGEDGGIGEGGVSHRGTPIRVRRRERDKKN